MATTFYENPTNRSRSHMNFTKNVDYLLEWGQSYFVFYGVLQQAASFKSLSRPQKSQKPGIKNSSTHTLTSPTITRGFLSYTARKMKISINDFFSKYDKIRSFLRIWSHLLKKSLMEKFIFSAVLDEYNAKLLLKLS